MRDTTRSQAGAKPISGIGTRLSRTDLGAGRRSAWIASSCRHPKTYTEGDIGHYSMTSSARASSVAGMFRRKAFAVLRLIASSYSVGCITGRSAGGVPPRTLPV